MIYLYDKALPCALSCDGQIQCTHTTVISLFVEKGGVLLVVLWCSEPDVYSLKEQKAYLNIPKRN